MNASRRLMVLAGAMTLSASLFAYTSNIWQPVDGNWNGDYTDVRHWSLGHLPYYVDSSTGEDAVFLNTSGKEIVINVNCTVGEGDVPLPAFVAIGAKSDKVVKDSLSPVRFTGSGTVRQSTAQFYVWADGKVILDDNVFFDMEDTPSDLTHTNRLFEIRGNARFKTSFLRLTSSDTLRIKENGVLELAGYVQKLGTGEPPTVDFAGGKVVAKEGSSLSTPWMFPRGTGVYDYQAVGSANTLVFNDPVDQELSGTFSATNNWGMKFQGSSSTLWGRGKLEVGLIYTPSAKSLLFDLSRINLGTGYYVTGGSVTYPRDITLAMYGADARTDLGSTHDVNIYGNVTIDTTDAHDGVTPRKFSQPHIVPASGTLRVIGGGTAQIAPRDAAMARNAQVFRTAEVAAGAALELRPTHSTPFRIGPTTLGANAKLVEKAANVTFDFVSLTADPTAKLEIDVAGLTATDVETSGNLIRPAVSATSGEGIPLANVTLKNNTANWVAKKVGGTIYLRNDATKFQNPSPYFWTGAVDGDWSKAGNWQSNAVPDAASTVYFGVSDGNNEVTIPEDGVTVKRFSGAGLYSGHWYRSSEPCVFRGGKLTIAETTSSANYDSAFFDCGQMPKVFENDVEFTGDVVNLCTYSSVAFNGAFTAKQLNLQGGDYRFGGTAEVTCLYPYKKYVDAVRDHSVHVTSGGSLTVKNQSVSMPVPLPMIVDANATLTFNGSYHNTTETGSFRHLVDGRLDIVNHYIARCDQEFAGAGRVDIGETRAFVNNVHIDIRSGITLNLKAFETSSSGYPAASLAIRVPDFADATVGALADWTYGPAAGTTPSTTVASRALTVGKHATLVLDTMNPDTQAGQTVTFADPLGGEGRVTVAGKGKVVLKSAANEIGELVISGGTVDVDRTLLAEKGWTNVLTAKAVEGLDGHVPDDLLARAVPNADGTVSLGFKFRMGTMLIIK